MLQTIDRIVEGIGDESARRHFVLRAYYVGGKGKDYRYFDISRDGFSLLAMTFTGDSAMQWKLRYIEVFEAQAAR